MIGWVQNIIPIITSIGLTVFLTFYLNIDLFALVLLAVFPYPEFWPDFAGVCSVNFLNDIFLHPRHFSLAVEWCKDSDFYGRHCS